MAPHTLTDIGILYVDRIAAPHTLTYIGILCVDRIVANLDRMIVPTTIAKDRVVVIKAVRWTNHLVVPL